MKRLFATLTLAAVALTAAACSSTNADSAAGPAASVDPNAPKIVAKDIAFTTPDVEVPAGAGFQLVFDNEDGAPHNVAIADASGASVFKGEIFSGAATRVYQVPALAAGTYTFTCEVHPGMTGTIVAN